ncbi:DsbC family protein [Marinobacter sp. G11]|uniref:DsbC family protein n=1 Tax=Marinobacter sp. G11 TaxID=2903522 RepID=UPI001E5CA2E2|nr:DsbC family protein [Marinobacter sp. G11]MCE0759506.1 DsbC family protein [Marinobacter sp. G11]
MRKQILNAIAIAGLSLSTITGAHAVELDLAPGKNKLDAIVELPIKKVRAVEANGEILFLSENGRFVLRGQLYDVWYKDTVDTMKEMEDTATRIHFDRMGADLDDYNTLSIGDGEKQVVAFVDPQCPVCHKLMKDAEKLGDDYTFKFVVVPALGEKSNELARKVFCAKDREDALEAYMSQDLETLPQKTSCDTAQYDMTLMMATLLDVQGVPFVVAPDGRMSKGRPSELENWLEGKQ